MKNLFFGGVGLALSLLFSNQSPVLAQSSNSDSAAAAGAGALVRVNQGSSSTTENTSHVGGTVNNVGVNNNSGVVVPGRATQDGVTCEVPTFEASGVLTNPGNDFSQSQSVVLSFRTPLRSLAQVNCENRSSVVLRQSELDTTLNLIRFCVDMQSLGVSLNEMAPQELVEACKMIGN